jgi:hypothetical protein
MNNPVFRRNIAALAVLDRQPIQVRRDVFADTARRAHAL